MSAESKVYCHQLSLAGTLLAREFANTQTRQTNYLGATLSLARFDTTTDAKKTKHANARVPLPFSPQFNTENIVLGYNAPTSSFILINLSIVAFHNN